MMKRRQRHSAPIGLTLLILLTAVLNMTAQTLENPLRINSDDNVARQGGGMIAVGRDGTIYTAWVDFRLNNGGDLLIRSSVDGGASFSTEYIIYAGGNVPAGRGRGTDLVVAPDGTLHVVWMELVGSSTDIRYSRSTDGGLTFSSPVSLTGDDAGAAQDFPSMAIDSSGVLHVGWIDGRDMMRGNASTDQIYTTRSTDGGLTFTDPVRASQMLFGQGGSCECCGTDMAVSADGNDLFISFRSNINNNRDLFIARSQDGGKTFGTAIPAASSTWKVFACPMTGTGLAVDREGTLHIVWSDGRQAAGGKDYIYYTLLRKGADSVLPDRVVALSKWETNYPALTITPSGILACTFENIEGGRFRKIYVISDDGGNTFQLQSPPAAEEATWTQEMPVVTTGASSQRYLLWQDDRQGSTDIWFARDDRTIPPVTPEPVAPLSPMADARLSGAIEFAWEVPSNMGGGENVLYDLSIYPSNGTGDTIIINDIVGSSRTLSLQPGTYEWSVVARTITGRSISSTPRTLTVEKVTTSVPLQHLFDELDLSMLTGFRNHGR